MMQRKERNRLLSNILLDPQTVSKDKTGEYAPHKTASHANPTRAERSFESTIARTMRETGLARGARSLEGAESKVAFLLVPPRPGYSTTRGKISMLVNLRSSESRVPRGTAALVLLHAGSATSLGTWYPRMFGDIRIPRGSAMGNEEEGLAVPMASGKRRAMKLWEWGSCPARKPRA